MSSTLSVVALVIASYTFWSQPPAYFPQQASEIAEPPQPAEFSCQARCPSPAAASAVVFRGAGPGAGVAFAFVAGFLSCLALFAYWQRTRWAWAQSQQRDIVEQFALVEPRDREPLAAIRGPLTPAARRALRAQRNDAA